VFATLRGLFPAAPADESDVERGAVFLEQLWERLRRLYAPDPSAGLGAAGGGGTDPALGELRRRQLRADAQDRALETATRDGRTDIGKAVRQLLEEAAGREAAGDPAAAQALLEEAVRWEEAGDVEAARGDRRFGWPECERLRDRAATITRPL